MENGNNWSTSRDVLVNEIEIIKKERKVSVLLRMYERKNLMEYFGDEIEMALFNCIDSCSRKGEYDKIKKIIENPFVNDNIVSNAKRVYNKRDKGIMLETPKSFEKCTTCKNCNCGKLDKKQSRN